MSKRQAQNHGRGRADVGARREAQASGAATAATDAASPTLAEQLQHKHGNRALSRWLTSGSMQMDGGNEREADSLADQLRSGQGAHTQLHEDTSARQTDSLTPQAEALVRDSIAAQGSALPIAFRTRAERYSGASLEAIQVHTGPRATAAADALQARAFAYGSHLIFGAGEYAPHSDRGESLLAHEVAHSMSQRSAAPVVQRKGKPRTESFGEVVDKFDTNIKMLQEFITELEQIPPPLAPKFQDRIKSLRDMQTDLEKERAATRYVAKESAALPTRGSRGGGTEESRPAALPPDSGVDKDIYAKVVDIYYGSGNTASGPPAQSSLRKRRGQLERGKTLVQIVRATVLNIIGSLPVDAPDAQRDVTLEVASYYLQCGVLIEGEALAQLAFLDVHYADPAVFLFYAAVRQAKRSLLEIGSNIDKLNKYANSAVTRHSTPDTPVQDREPLFRALGEADEWRERLRLNVERLGDPPSRGQGAKATPTLDEAMWFSVVLRYFAMAQGVLALWIPTAQLSEELGRVLYAGTWPGSDDRKRWQDEMSSLKKSFMDEFSGGGTKGFETRIGEYEPRVQKLIDEIPPELRKRKIIAVVAEQIPTLMVGGGIASGVGRFVASVTRGSRWLIAIAEGVTMTALSALTLPASSRPKTVLGWGAHLALNIGWSRVGRALFDFGGDVARGMSMSRNAMVRAGMEIVLPTATMATLQTAVQMIEAQATNAGGETNFTEALTINLVMSSLAVFCGAAMNSHTTGGKTPTSAELARSANIDESAAQRWLELAQRSSTYFDEMTRLQTLAKRGTLTSKEFDEMKANGAKLADDMDATMPDLAKTLGMNHTPAEIRGAIAAFRAKLAGLTYSPKPTVTAVLPEYTGGLTRANNVTFVYDGANPPKDLAKVRASLASRGYTIIDNPTGGFEARSGGKVILQVLPAGRASLAALPPSISTVAKGPVAQEGLARVRAQTGSPSLEGLLAGAGATNAAATMRVLQTAGRSIQTSDAAAWKGMATYLDKGGDIGALARAISHYAARQEPLEAQSRASTVLRLMAGWDASAVRGLAVIVRHRPDLTGERIEALFTGFEPKEVVGILQSLDRLEPVVRNLGAIIGPLASTSVPVRIGGVGSLTTAVQTADKFPGHKLAFEESVFDDQGRTIRIQDLNVYEIQKTTVAGVTTESERLVFTIETKEVSTAWLGVRGPHQFAVDMWLDSMARAKRVVPVGAARPFFETFQWRIKRSELQEKAMRALGTKDAKDPRVEPEMRKMVTKTLEKGFSDPVMKNLSDDERDGYRKAFDAGLPFVEFF
jgi:hypothetical protein